jgi:hypothetical protein
LPYKQDLDEFRLCRLKIRQEPDGFQHRFVQVLSFVDHQNETAARKSFPGQKLVQLLVQGDEIVVAAVYSQAAEQIAEQLPRVALCLKEKDGAARLAQSLEKLENQRCFPHSRVSRECQETPAALDAVDESQKRFTMGLAEIEETRVWCYPERIFPQPVGF